MPLAAVVGVGIPASISGYLYFDAERAGRSYENQAKEKAAYYSGRARVVVETTCIQLPPANQRDCIREQAQAARQSQHDEYDLQAQRETAAWTRAMGIAALVAMFFGIVGVGLIFITFRETRKGTAAMVRSNQIVEEGQRPWITIESRMIAFTFDGVWLHVGLQATFKNIGKSAATGFNTWAQIVWAGDDFGVTQPIYLRMIKPQPGFLNLLPGEEETAVEVNNFRIDDLPWTGEPPNEEVSLLFLASARYRLAGYGEEPRSQKLTFAQFSAGAFYDEPRPGIMRIKKKDLERVKLGDFALGRMRYHCR